MGRTWNPYEARRRFIPLCTLVVLSFFISLASATMCTSDNLYGRRHDCCNPCAEPFYFRWPAKSSDLVKNSINATCEGIITGIDIKAADGEPVYAIAEGRIRSAEGILPEFNDYNCGCGVVLETTDGRWKALYCHLFDESQMRAGYGGIIRRGDVLGHAGGDQNDTRCRGGNTEGPKLHFELWYNYPDGWAPVEPNSCFPDTCNFWYTIDGISGNEQCTPAEGYRECQITPRPRTGGGPVLLKWPTYASEPYYSDRIRGTPYWYARVNILRTGDINITASDVYDINLDKLNSRVALNAFIKPLRVFSDGEYVCGRINNAGNIVWDLSYCVDIIGIGLTEYQRDNSLGSNSIHFMDYKYRGAGGVSNYGKFLTVSEEYAIIGANDRDLINRYHANPNFNVELDGVYYVDYVLARKCDLQGNTVVTMSCKNDRIGYYNESFDYEGNVRLINYTDCEWEIADAGRYFDYPGVYLSSFNFSRMATYTGFGLYTIGEEVLKQGISHIAPESIDQSMWWNRNAASRTVGCDGCEKMNDNIACTMGSSLAQRNFFSDGQICPNYNPGSGTPPYFPEVDCYIDNDGDGVAETPVSWGCGFWSKTGADYFGFNDKDDDTRLFQDNVYDNSYDKESGIPDKDLVKKSLMSVKSNVSIYVIKDVDWKGPPNWINIYNPGDQMSVFAQDLRAHSQDWLMPCKVDTEIRNHCFFNYTWIVYDRVSDADACRAAGYTDCVGWISYPDHPDCNHYTYCQNSAGQLCPLGKDCNPHPKWECRIERTDSGHEGEICLYTCCLGGVRITDDEFKNEVLDYEDYSLHVDAQTEEGGTGYGCNDNEPDILDNNPQVLLDDDNVRDRYWITDPVYGNENYAKKLSCTRPRYDSGESGRSSDGRPASLQHNPCEPCRKDDTCPELCMNWDIKYYRQFNIETVWSRVFKITPEVNLFHDSENNYVNTNPACVKVDQNPEAGKLNIGDEGCINDRDCTGGTVCTAPDGMLGNPMWGHCCPSGTTYDLTYGCCMQCGVNSAYMYSQDYCQRKMELGCRCELGEGNCRDDSECGGRNLTCKDNINSAAVDNACCGKDQNWTGKDCMPLDDLTPWYRSYTRTGIGSNSQVEGGGGPVWFMVGGGAMIPTDEEGAGYGNEWCWDFEKKCMYARSYKDDPNVQTIYGSGPKTQERYSVTPGPWKSPIWFETKNLGNLYVPETSRELDNDPGLYCWSYIWPWIGEPGDERRDCKPNDCNCGRDMWQNGEKEDGVCPGVMQPTSCKRGSIGGGGGYGGGEQGSAGPEHYCKWGPSSGTMIVEEWMPVLPQADRIPKTCGEIYRKDVEIYGNGMGIYPYAPGYTPLSKRADSFNPQSWFNYNIYENGNKVVNGEPTTRGRFNILPLPTDPWTMLDYQALPRYGYNVNDGNRIVEADTNYSAFNSFNRRVIVEECIWYGCSRLEEVLTTVNRVHDFDERIGPTYAGSCPIPIVTNCKTCYHKRDYCCKEEGLDYHSYCNTGKCDTDGDMILDTITYYHDQCYCKDVCWGCWHHQGLSYNYPVSKPDEYGEEQVQFEVFNETATVESNRYGDHVTLEGSIGAGNSPFEVTGKGLINYKIPWKPKSNYVNGLITVKVTDRETRQLDMLNGFDLEVPDSIVLKFVSTDYPYSHDLTSLESSEGRRIVAMSEENSKFMEHGLETTETEKGKIGIDPIKKYYFRQDNYKGFATRYSKIKDFHDMSNIWGRWWPEISPGTGLFSNYQEDYNSYWDFAGFSPMPLDTKAFSVQPQEGLSKTTYNVQQDPYSDKFVEHVNAYVDHAPDCSNAPYSRRCTGNDISSCNPEMCNTNSNLNCTAGLCDCRYKPKEPIPDNLCKEAKDWDHFLMFDCDDPRSPVKSHCTREGYWAYWRDKLILKYRWDNGTSKCAIQVVKSCVPVQVEENSYTILFDSDVINPKKYDNATLTIYTPLRSIKVQPFNSGMAENCEGPVDVTQGNLRLQVGKPHPIRAEVRKTGDNTVIIVGIDGCTGEDVNHGFVYVNFVAPYSKYSGYYAVNTVITLDNVKEGSPVISTNIYVDNEGLVNSPVSQSVIPMRDPALDVWNYFMNNYIWIILLGLIAVISYRFFSGRAMDFQEAMEEFKGKK